METVDTKKYINIDNFMWLLTVCYLIFPIIIFAFGWLKLPIAMVGTVVLFHFVYEFLKEVIKEGAELFTKQNINFWIVSILILLIWVYFSGIGSMSFQNSDYWVRNPIYKDLCNNDWPIVYDLSVQPDNVKEILGNKKVAFSYYFTWWLSPALVSKSFNLSDDISNLLLYFHGFLGVLIVLFLLCKIIKKCELKILVLFISFSGLDIVSFLLKSKSSYNFFRHIEWSCGFPFQFSGNTTQLYWVFNQSIPVWIITALLFIVSKSKIVVAIGSLCFAYSPWATFGIIPIVFYKAFMGKGKILNKLMEALTIGNLLVPTFIGVVYGLFYLANGNTPSKINFTLFSSKLAFNKVLINYMFLIFTEVIVFVIAMGKKPFKNPLYSIAIVELLLFPLVYIRDENFIIRGSIPALFLLMIFCLKYIESDNNKSRKYALVLLLFIGSITSFNEIARSVCYTAVKDDIVCQPIKSFSYMETNDKYLINTASSQFFVYDYDNKAFFKYLSK